MSKQEDIKCKKEQLKWTENMDEVLVNAMIRQQDKGNKVNGTFTTQAYTNIIEELNTNLQMTLTKNHVMNRLKTLKKQFSQWYDMFRGTSLSGFSWNSNTQLIEAEDEVWKNLIDQKPEAVTLKTKRVSNYNELIELFGRDRASGENAETAKEKSARLNMNAGIKIDNITEVDELLATNKVTLESQHNNDDDIRVISPTDFPLDPSSGAKKLKSKKKKVEQENEDAANSKLINCVESVASAIKEGNKILERAYHLEYSGDEICRELEPMDLSPDEIENALIYLSRNQSKARTLFSIPLQMRMGVLKKMMAADK